jgi:NAD(P)-dependent dehydrogenase (short-subunit alcohol dehydrogenase family)
MTASADGGALAGKAALVTGGTTGLGLEIARRFLEEGAAVAITGRDESFGAAAVTALSPLGDLTYLRADAADPAQVADSVARAVGHLGGLDVLVNNAGIGAVAGVFQTPLETYDAIMAVNVRGAFCYAQAAFPHLEARRGCMLHVASDAGVTGEVEIAIYSVSKAALIMLSNMLAIEGGRRGVRSNAICPGDTAPGMRHMNVPGERGRPDDPDTWPLPPVGRIGRARDVAEAAVYLASERASFVNGVALLVDGGMRAGMRTATSRDGTAV